MSGDQADDVDYRYLLANERTFLAWIRTSLGVIAGGVALDQFVGVGSATDAIGLLAVIIITFGVLVAVVGTVRWSRTDTLMRRHLPMPRERVVLVLGACVAVLGVAMAVLIAGR